MRYDIEINGLPVQAKFSQTNIENIFLPLLRRLKDMQEKKGARILVMLAAPPGAGKSTLVSFLEHLAARTEGLPAITTIGMDGFHRYQDYLLTHTMIRNGETIPMVRVKGTPETFDLALLKERIAMVAEGQECGWPTYNRLTHNPEENAVTVSGDIVLLEGNYLLLDQEGWKELSHYADYTIKISADEKQLQKRLLERKFASMLPGIYEKYGWTSQPTALSDPAYTEIMEKEKAVAAAFVKYSDLYNARLCLQHSKAADLELKLRMDNTFLSSD